MFRCTIVLLALVGLASGLRLNPNEVEAMLLEEGEEEASTTEMFEVEMSLEEYRAEHADILSLDADVEFIDFDKIKSWATSQTKKLLNTIKGQAAETATKVTSIVKSYANNFKHVLNETMAKTAEAVEVMKGKIVTALSTIKGMALEELPKFYSSLDSLKVKIAEARDALTSQLMSGSLTGAAAVLQEHIGILFKEARATTIPALQQQFDASAKSLREKVTPILQQLGGDAKALAENIFNGALQNSTDLVTDMLRDVKKEATLGVKEIGKTTSTEVMDMFKNKGWTDKFSLAEESEGSRMLTMQSAFSQEQLDFQLSDLLACRDKLVQAAKQATASFMEKDIDVTMGLGRRIGRYVGELKGQLSPTLRAMKEKAMDALKKKLSHIQGSAVAALADIRGKLASSDGSMGKLADLLSEKYGDVAKDWSAKLKAFNFEKAAGVVGDATETLQSLFARELSKAAGQFQASVLTSKGQEQQEALGKLSDTETGVNDARARVYKLAKLAMASLQNVSGIASEDIRDIVDDMRAKLGHGSDVAEMVAALFGQVDKSFDLSFVFGNRMQSIVKQAAAALAADPSDGFADLLEMGRQAAAAALKKAQEAAKKAQDRRRRWWEKVSTAVVRRRRTPVADRRRRWWR